MMARMLSLLTLYTTLPLSAVMELTITAMAALPSALLHAQSSHGHHLAQAGQAKVKDGSHNLAWTFSKVILYQDQED